ncbi:MAG: zinc ribbon domain-containing protein [Acidobacteria bacterium]|nr:zinc ribbon domain-containing protein [Acidobacteriota bacterium]
MEKYCPNCRQPNALEAQFCRFCATSLAAAPTFQQNPPTFQQNPPYYGNQQWNQPFAGGPLQSPNYAAPAPGASGRAIASLALTIGGLLLCCLLSSVPGAILGWMEVSAIKEGRSSPKGMTMAQIGLWGGLVVTLLNLIFYGIYLLMVLSAGAGSY